MSSLITEILNMNKALIIHLCDVLKSHFLSLFYVLIARLATRVC